MRSRHCQKMNSHHFFSNQCTTASFLVSRLAFITFIMAKQGRVYLSYIHHGEAGEGIPFLLLRNAILGVALGSKLRSLQPEKEAIFAAILFLSMV